MAFPILCFGVNFNIAPPYLATYFNFCTQEVCPRTAIPLPGIQYADATVVLSISVNHEQPLSPQLLYLHFMRQRGNINA